MRRVAILGSTGSIGQSALAVVAAHRERVRVVCLAAGENTALLVEQAREHRPAAVAAATPAAREDLRERLAGTGIEVLPAGCDGLVAAATHPDADLVLCASSGSAASTRQPLARRS